MTESLKPYRYKPLSSLVKEIRLITLLPGAGLPINIKILHVEKAKNPKYEALSYVWGSPERTSEVVVEGRWLQPRMTLSIAQKLFIALLHLRHETQERTIWADAICINQDDLDERSREVAKMGSIYANAEQVVVWLGEESEDSSLAIQMLRHIALDVDFRDISDNKWSFKTRSKTQTRLLEKDPETMKSKQLSWLAIRHLLERQWFTRLWVYQEIFLASKAVIIVGIVDIDWRSFRAAIFWIRRQSKVSATLSSSIPLALRTTVESLARHNEWCKIGYSYGSILVKTQNAICLDAHDRIYAILALLVPVYEGGIVPDYSKPVEDIYTEVVLQVIQVDKVLSLFEFINFRNEGPRSSLSLPSWVPDFSDILWHIKYPAMTLRTMEETKYREALQRLETLGVILGTIKSVSTHVAKGAGIEEILGNCRAWQPLNASTTPYKGSGTVLEAFVALLSLGLRLNSSKIVYRLGGNKTEFLAYAEGAYEAAVADGLDKQNVQEFKNRLEKSIPGQAFIATEEGYIGLTSVSARSGDLYSIILGCPWPLILRRIPDQSQNYHVIGCCFIEGLMLGQGLLGPIPRNITAKISEIFVGGKMHRSLVFTDSEGHSTQLDPRGGPLPPNWSIVYGEDEVDEGEATGEKIETERMWFKNMDTGERTKFDPRMTSANLRARGVDIQDIFLV